MNDVAATPAPVSAPALRELPIEFRGTGGEYFRIWIVNLLLTIVTLGIYSAWAKVRRLRYFYGSTSLDGSSFEYHGRPVAILKGRLIVFGVYLVFVALGYLWPKAQLVAALLVIAGLPWIIVRSRLFQMRMTSWRGLRFNFHGRYGGALLNFIVFPLLSLLTLMGLWPYAQWRQVNYFATNTAYGAQRFGFTTTVGTYYRIFLVLVGMSFLGFLVGVGGVAMLVGLVIGVTAAAGGGGPEDMAAVAGAALAMSLSIAVTVVLVTMLLQAYYRAHFLNASVGGVNVGPHRLNSRLRTMPLLGILLTNLLGMVFTLGLFYPWAKIRLLRYQLANTSVTVEGDLGQFVADAAADASALGEEAGDFLDIDFGI